MRSRLAPKFEFGKHASLLLAHARRGLPLLLAQLGEMAAIESPTEDKAACEQVLALTAAWARALGGVVRAHRHARYADSLEARFGPARRGRKPLLLLGHVDTVWPHGTLRTMPFRVGRDRISGPGVLDMKGGIAMAFAALRMLSESGLLRRPVTLLLHGDEEVGSPESRPATQRIAQQCDAVYVLEPAQGAAGAYKTARKGVGQYRLTVRGVAAHSGVDFEAGHSAIVELARQLTSISSLTDPARGLTVNPGVIGGGTLPNVVAAEAWAEIDVRVARAADKARVEQHLARLRPADRACSLQISGGMNRPPMVRTHATAKLFARAREYAAELGFALEETSTGGGSDGNLTAALGIATLDGMGAVGAGAHAPHEHLLRHHLAPRTALLAAMLCTDPA